MNTAQTELSYAASAYDSTSIPSQPPHRWREDENRTGLRRTQLNWGYYAGLNPWQLVDGQLRGQEQTWLERTGDADIYCNHQRWRFENFNKILTLVPLFKYISLLLLPWLFAVVSLQAFFPEVELAYFIMAFAALPLCALSAWLYWGRGLKAYLYLMSLPVALAALAGAYNYLASGDYVSLVMCGYIVLAVFMGVVGFDSLLDLYLRVFKHDGSEISRQTGMVTIARRFRKPFVAPFHEFDVTMEYRQDPLGGGGMALWLYHRYTTCKVFLGGKLHPLGLKPEEAMAFWDCMQRYMDVSQPLPELPVLEQFRHLDQTSVQYDVKKAKPSRRWRDFDPRAWQERGLPDAMRRNAAYRWQQQPCILRARIDPQLSIEAYYRDQEARGIQATPKADDYDNVHRG